mgnify:CR=1 FL=1
MKKLILLFSLFISLVITNNIFASELETSMTEGGEIKGKLIDSETDSPLEYATISLFYAQDSTLATGVISDDKGWAWLVLGSETAWESQVS